MTYYESAEGTIITAKRAKQEVENHGIEWTEFVDSYGDQETYTAQAVLSWLGY